jgi:hypothetical protein
MAHSFTVQKSSGVGAVNMTGEMFYLKSGESGQGMCSVQLLKCTPAPSHEPPGLHLVSGARQCQVPALASSSTNTTICTIAAANAKVQGCECM